MADYLNFRDHVVATLKRLNIVADADFDLKESFDALIAQYENLQHRHTENIERARTIMERCGQIQQNLSALRSVSFEIRSSTDESKQNASAHYVSDSGRG